MTGVTVHTVTRDDLDALVASVTELFREDAGTHDPSTDQQWPVREGTDYYAGLMNDETCLLALARDGDRPVGHLVGKLSESNSIRTERLAILESLRVAPQSRGTGVGGLLVEHFLAWARQHEARQASVTAYAANEAAQRLYARFGFTPMSVTMRARL
jgi:GNAT superfamily N-acetyltransferase